VTALKREKRRSCDLGGRLEGRRGTSGVSVICRKGSSGVQEFRIAGEDQEFRVRGEGEFQEFIKGQAFRELADSGGEKGKSELESTTLHLKIPGEEGGEEMNAEGGDRFGSLVSRKNCSEGSRLNNLIRNLKGPLLGVVWVEPLILGVQMLFKNAGRANSKER